MEQTANANGAEQESSARAKIIGFCKSYWAIIGYTGIILPFCTYFLVPGAALSEDLTVHRRHKLMYVAASIAASSILILVCYLFVCWKKCRPERTFTWKTVAAIVGPFVLIVCNVFAPRWLEPQARSDLYRSYLIGRLCFLMAVTMLFCILREDEMPNRQYEEGLVQLRIAWAAFALLFASDPILAHLSNAYTQNSALASQLPPDNIIGALIHLNFCGGITLVLLPLWKLSKLRREMMRQVREAGALTPRSC